MPDIDLYAMPRIRKVIPQQLDAGIFKLAMRLGGNALKRLQILRELEWKSEGDLFAYKQAQLQSILDHASRHVPYYRRILTESGVVDQSGRLFIERLTNAPLLDRTMLHERFDEFKSSDLAQRKWHINSSGGSTGEPAQFIQDREFGEWSQAVSVLFDLWSGYSMGELKFLLWPKNNSIKSRRRRLNRQIGALLRNETWMDDRRMTAANMRKFLSWIPRYRPAQLRGIPENLGEFARFAIDEGFQSPPLKAVVTGGAKLHPSMLAQISDAFGAPVFNRYGSREVGDIASQCRLRQGLHVSPATHYLEILRPDGSAAPPGELGEVVVTSLVNRAMPLIRYRIGDTAAWAEAPCSCGRAWPVIEGLIGRTRDLFIKRDDTRVRILESTFHRYSWIKKYQVIQEDYDSVRALIVPHESDLPEPERHSGDIQKIKDTIIEQMGKDCKVNIELTNEIKSSPSGKYRYQISEVRPPDRQLTVRSTDT